MISHVNPLFIQAFLDAAEHGDIETFVKLLACREVDINTKCSQVSMNYSKRILRKNS